MKLEILSENNRNYFAAAQELYETAFPYLEKRDESEQARIMRNPAYKYGLILSDDGDFDGIMLYWETSSFVYLEHFAIQPDKRNQGRATNALEILKAQSNKLIILEIDPPCDKISERRYSFYRKNGFIMNTYRHIQPKYHFGDADLELKILTYPREITTTEYSQFSDFLAHEVVSKIKSDN